MCDELSDQRPAGGGLDRIRAAFTTVTDTAGGPERKQGFVRARERGQLGKEASVTSGGSVNRGINRADGGQAMIAIAATVSERSTHAAADDCCTGRS